MDFDGQFLRVKTVRMVLGKDTVVTEHQCHLDDQDIAICGDDIFPECE